MIEITNTTRSRIPAGMIRRTAAAFLTDRKIEGKDLSIAFVGDRRMRSLNRQYRKKDRPTDILSFSDSGDCLGELVIDLKQIERQAKRFSPNTAAELRFILVHGLLHLLGHDDATEQGRKEMERLATVFLAKSETRNAKREES
jgi:probable rRNA maturation factor